MPIELEGFEAWIDSGGKEIACYGVEKSEDGKEVTCWIPSEEGKGFSVKWTRDSCRSTTPWSGQVQVDDIVCKGVCTYPGNSKDIFSRHGFPTSSSTIKPFLFGAVNLTDDDRFLDMLPSKNLGDIKLEIWKSEIEAPGTGRPRVPPKEQQVHERSKKAAIHRVQLGAEIVCFQKSVQTKIISTCATATFIFKYRPIAVLRANGIVLPVAIWSERLTAVLRARGIVSLPAGNKRKAVEESKEEVDSDSEFEKPDPVKDARRKAIQEELRTLRARQIKDLEDELQALQPTPSGSGKKKAKRMKFEPPIPAGFISGEVIDLT
ncbi:hypothetical protein FIBSPDRAFT_242086 [Athelia psychrophila]|uniref:DUF7918 domain-containing protein n=1 Tax=Athelia psychrophila TaxID=1759441 RepID=A0A165Y547_9AGAM|nr:hypothetical protein FIBSPDRAFT_242086 [Fibularhizoctonia sp. CBS 109695]